VYTESPVIDGVLEEEWKRAPVAENFIQREPDEGVPATQKTEVRVMYSDDALYVAFRCTEDDPSQIESTLNKRDRIWNSDRVVFWLDTYHDHRNAFVFGTNPHSVKFDGTFYNDDDEESTWDGFWEVATAVDDSGWVAEFKIPFATLRFADVEGEQIWGFNAFRYIQRNKEMDYWQPVTRDKRERVSELGHLEGLEGLKPGRGLEFRPYAVANFEEEGMSPLQGKNDWENLGLDVKYRVASNLTMDATLNPDFAQIEADDEVINLSDYPVYLTEKRPFFMEGAELFNTSIELFYSRRITNPQAGVKLTGKVGGTQLAAIAARNLNADDQIEDFAVIRLKRDVFRRSEIGLLLTDKQGPGENWARVWSVDTRLQPGDPWSVRLQVAQSFKPGLEENNGAYSLRGSYLSDRYSATVWAEGMQKNFRGNDAGWIRYTDFQRTGMWMQFALRPEKWGIRRMGNNINGGLEWQVDGRFLEKWINYNNFFQTMNYMYFGFGASYNDTWRRNYVDDDEEYQYSDNFGNFNMENYWGGWQWIWYETDFSKPFALGINYSQGDFRDGFSRDLGATLQILPKDNLALQIQEESNWVSGVSDIDDGRSTRYFVGRFKLEWTFSLRLFTRLNLQYVHEEEDYLTNALLGYEFAPESYLYLVYDDDRSSLLGWNSVQDRKIKIKLVYFCKFRGEKS
jgi:hypothetical protein